MISSQVGGTLGVNLPIDMSMSPYGVSKAAVNNLARRLHVEHEADGLGELTCTAGPAGIAC
jgi:NAD(P)-dependent dehydrogenase (short-subunit alcohol dehydrogenase family)